MQAAAVAERRPPGLLDMELDVPPGACGVVHIAVRSSTPLKLEAPVRRPLFNHSPTTFIPPCANHPPTTH
eukprot:320638-Chlamydomonas_euryale.AAC.1